MAQVYIPSPKSLITNSFSCPFSISLEFVWLNWLFIIKSHFEKLVLSLGIYLKVISSLNQELFEVFKLIVGYSVIFKVQVELFLNYLLHLYNLYSIILGHQLNHLLVYLLNYHLMLQN